MCLPPLRLNELGTSDARVIEYIKRVYESSDFRKNPRRYMDQWREKRGATEEHRVPEDEAYAILFCLVTYPSVGRSGLTRLVNR
jgi:hypothetical protein